MMRWRMQTEEKVFLKKSNFQEKGNATFLWLKQWFQQLLFQDDKTRGKNVVLYIQHGSRNAF